MALENGWFAEAGIELELLEPKEHSDAFAAMRKGELDVAITFRHLGRSWCGDRQVASRLDPKMVQLREQAEAARAEEDWDEVERLGALLLISDHAGLRIGTLFYLADAAIAQSNTKRLAERVEALKPLVREMGEAIGKEDSRTVDATHRLLEIQDCLLWLGARIEIFTAFDAGRFEDARQLSRTAYDAGNPSVRDIGILGLAWVAVSVDPPDPDHKVLRDLQQRVDELRAAGDSEAPSAVVLLHRCKAIMLNRCGHSDLALEHATLALEAEPCEGLRMVCALYKKRAGRLDEAITELESIHERRQIKDPVPLIQFLSGCLHLAGRAEEAQAVYALLSDDDKARPELRSNEAWIAACQGDREACLANVESSLEYEGGASSLPFYRLEPEFDPYRDDPRFPAEASGGRGRRDQPR